MDDTTKSVISISRFLNTLEAKIVGFNWLLFDFGPIEFPVWSNMCPHRLDFQKTLPNRMINYFSSLECNDNELGVVTVASNVRHTAML